MAQATAKVRGDFAQPNGYRFARVCDRRGGMLAVSPSHAIGGFGPAPPLLEAFKRSLH